MSNFRLYMRLALLLFSAQLVFASMEFMMAPAGGRFLLWAMLALDVVAIAAAAFVLCGAQACAPIFERENCEK